MTAIAANDGLSATNGVLAVIDDSSIETNSDALRIKASGHKRYKLSSSIANGKLANSAVTVTHYHQVVVQYHLEVQQYLEDSWCR